MSTGKYQQFRGIQYLQYVYYLSVNRAQYPVRPESSALLCGTQFSQAIFCTCTNHFHHTAFTGIVQRCMWSRNPNYYRPQRFITPSKSLQLDTNHGQLNSVYSIISYSPLIQLNIIFTVIPVFPVVSPF